MKREVFLPKALLRLIPLLLLLTVAGCGQIDWFPEYVRLPTTPDDFSFKAKTNTEKSVSITSDAITVTGLTGASSPISVTGSTESKSTYTINDGTATSADGTVKNGDTVTVIHTSAATLGTATVSTLSIGNVSAQFISTTRYVETPSFSLTVLQPAPYRQAMATITSVDGVVGTHVISIKDSANSGLALYGISDNDVIPTNFTNVTQTILFLNNRRIFVRNRSDVVDAAATTTLTIDGIDFVVKLTP